MGTIKTSGLPAPATVNLADVTPANVAATETRYLTIESLLESLPLVPSVGLAEASDTIISSNAAGTSRSLTFTQFRAVIEAARRFFPDIRFLYAAADGNANAVFNYGLSTVGYGATTYVEPDSSYPFGFRRHTGIDGGRSWIEFGTFFLPTVSYGLYRTRMNLSNFVGGERWFAGLTSLNNAGMTNNTPSGHYSMFRYCPALGDTQIMAVSCAGVALTREETPLGIQPDGTWREYDVRIKPSPLRAEFYLSGAKVATHSVRVPTSGLSCYHFLLRTGATTRLDWRDTWMLAT